MPREIIFTFIWHFIGAILSKKSCQKREIRKKYKNGEGGWPYKGGRRGCLLKGRFKTSAHYDIERPKGGTLEPWITEVTEFGGDTWFEKGDLRPLFIPRQFWIAELTLLQIMISVRWQIPLGMVQKLKGIAHTRRCGGNTNWY